MKRKILGGSGLLLVGVLGYGIFYGWQALPIATAYGAKIMCSCVFVSERTEESVRQQDLSSFGFIDFHINHLDRSVEADFWQLGTRKAIYREGLGCTLLNGVDSLNPTQQDLTINKPPPEQARQFWPTGDFEALATEPTGVDAKKLTDALDEVFAEPDPEHLQGTRAVVVVHLGKIVAERYAEGFTMHTPLIGWSMAKSITNAFAGILVYDNVLSLEDDHLFPEWENDRRSTITVDNLLRMNSGLKWDEQYSGISDATKMLFAHSDASSLPLHQPLEFDPGTHWEYSSGTSNLLSKLIKLKVNGTDRQYFNIFHSLFFNKIGMRSVVLEPDASGTFVGSSFMYATARDWTRFGLLYLNDGVWQGTRILPEGWVDYSRAVTPASQGRYAAHFWLTAGEPKGGQGLPEDAYHLSGYEGQKVVIVPSYDLVIVRLGFSQPESNWDFTGFVKGVLAAFPQNN